MGIFGGKSRSGAQGATLPAAFAVMRRQTSSVNATAMRPNTPPMITLATRSSAMPLAPPVKPAASAIKKQRVPKPTT